jgi:hypothetical protein
MIARNLQENQSTTSSVPHPVKLSIPVSELVWLYIKRRPFLKELLRERIVNYSALARKISIDAFGSKEHENAIKMALVRLTRKIEKSETNLEEAILQLLRHSSLSIKTKISVIISSKEIPDLQNHSHSYSESKGIITYIVDETEADRVGAKKLKTTIKIESNFNLIVIHSSPELEETPGFIAHILDSLAAEGINIVEFVSCYSDTILVVKQADTTRTHEILSGMMQ